MFVLYWPFIIIVTIFLYAMIILLLPFNPGLSTVALFALVGFWSRLPGVGMPSPLYVLYMMDFVDFFSLIVSVNIGGFAGGVFSVLLNMGSRFAGAYPSWLGVIKDSIAQFSTCLLIPYVYMWVGQDIFVAMIWYSIIRIFWFFPMRLLPVESSFPHFLTIVVGGGFAVLVINAAYAKLFGDFLDNLLKSGTTFNWILFLFVTVVILIAKILMFGNSKKGNNRKSMFSIKGLKKLIKRVID